MIKNAAAVFISFWEWIKHKWSYLQRSKFGANAQPFYVLLDNEGMPLNKSYSYDEDIQKYVEFLQTGLKNYKK